MSGSANPFALKQKGKVRPFHPFGFAHILLFEGKNATPAEWTDYTNFQFVIEGWSSQMRWET